jgi:hypothetical protein
MDALKAAEAKRYQIGNSTCTVVISELTPVAGARRQQQSMSCTSSLYRKLHKINCFCAYSLFFLSLSVQRNTELSINYLAHAVDKNMQEPV